MKPLNGSKTHPLSAHAMSVLRDLSEQPIPKQEINPGVINRLLRERLAELVHLPSPYKKHNGGTCMHLKITEQGLRTLKHQDKL